MLNYFISNYRLPILFTLIIFVTGILNFSTINREAFPNVNLASAKIVTPYPGATAKDVELLVTKKIEDKLKTISSIKKISSVSQNSYSEINVELDIDTVDVYKEMQDLQRVVSNINDLPDDLPSKPTFFEIKTSQLPILEYGITSEKEDKQELQHYANILQDNIELVKGVATVNKVGYLDPEIHVMLDPNKLRQYKVSSQEVIQAIAVSNAKIPGSKLYNRKDSLVVRLAQNINSIDDIKEIVIRSNFHENVIKVKDVAKVEDGFARPDVIASVNGKNAILFVITKTESADIIRLTANIKKAINASLVDMPEHIDATVTNDESARTDKRLDIVINNAVFGFILLLLVSILFLNYQTALVTSFSVPIVILASLTFMSWLGITFNLVSMLAIVIALGMFVDNSIVIAENIHRLIGEGLKVKEAAYMGVKELFAPLTATALTTISAFAPMVATTGILGQFIWSIPIIVGASLLFSLAESFYLLPSRIILFNKRKLKTTEHWFNKISLSFKKYFIVLLEHKYKTLGISFAALISVFVIGFFNINFVLFPSEGVDRFVVRYQAAPEVKIADLHKASKVIEARILQYQKDGVQGVANRAGVQQINASDPLSKTGENVGMMIVYLNDHNQRTKSADEFIQELKEHDDWPEIFTKVSFEKIANGPPIGRPVTITINSSDDKVLHATADKVKEFLGTIDGVIDIESDDETGPKELSFELNKDLADTYKISNSDIARQIFINLEGQTATKISDFRSDIDVKVMLDPKFIKQETLEENILLTHLNRNLTELGAFATVKEVQGAKKIKHFDFQRSITITSGVDLSKTTSNQINAKLLPFLQQENNKDPRFVFKIGGEEEESAKSVASLMNAMIIAILGIFSILVATLRSYFKPLLILVSIPFSLMGPIIGFMLHGKSFGFIASIGVIGLTGVVINAAIILVSVVDSYKEQGLSLKESLLKGIEIRLRPIILTTTTTIAALFPTAYGIGGYDPILVPMTLSMAWGLLFGTIITLIVVPCSYLALEEMFAKIKAYVQRVI